MRSVAMMLLLLTTTVATAGVEIVMHSELDIPGAKMTFMGQDLSQADERHLVDDAAELRGTVVGETTNWISLRHEAFFNQTKKRCTVTLFSEIDEQLEAMQQQGSPFNFGGGSEPSERDPQEFDVRLDSRQGGPATVAGLSGKSGEIDITVVDKKTGDVVSEIKMRNVYVKNAELALLDEFNRKFAERGVKSIGQLFGKDFGKMKGKMTDMPEYKRAIEELQKAGIGEDHTIAKSVTTITTKQQAIPADQGTADSGQAEEEEPGGFAGRMMRKLKAKRAAKSQDKQAQQGGEQKMTVSSELKSYKGGVDVALPARCVEAHAKKMKGR